MAKLTRTPEDAGGDSEGERTDRPRPRRRARHDRVARRRTRPRARSTRRASSTSRARRHHEAVEALRQAARLVPNEADFRAALGWALFRQAPADARAGRAAVAELRRALQLMNATARRPSTWRRSTRRPGNRISAVQELERLLAIDPGATEVAEELHRLRTK